MKIFLLYWLTILFHGDDLATFTVTKEANKLHVSVKLDALDLEEEIGTDIYTIRQKELSKYLKKHLEFHVNTKATSFTLTSFQFERNHLSAKLVLKKEYKTITELQIKNTALFEANPKQSNIIELRFDGMTRDFLIHKAKPVLTITF